LETIRAKTGKKRGKTQNRNRKKRQKNTKTGMVGPSWGGQFLQQRKSSSQNLFGALIRFFGKSALFLTVFTKSPYSGSFFQARKHAEFVFRLV